MNISKDTSRSAWTARDEAQLAELQERKRRIMAERRSGLIEVVGRVVGLNGISSDHLEGVTDSPSLGLMLPNRPFSCSGKSRERMSVSPSHVSLSPSTCA